MTKLKASERRHIDSLGSKWSSALAAASLSVRLDPRLVGLDKIREPLAVYAALNATGCPDHQGFVIPATAGPPMPDIQEVCDAAFLAAVKAARRAISVSA